MSLPLGRAPEDSGRRSYRMGCTAAAAGGLEAAALPFSPLTSKDLIDPGEGSSVKRATPGGWLVAPNLFQTERNSAELAIPKDCSLSPVPRSERIGSSPRRFAAFSELYGILQTVWRSKADLNRRPLLRHFIAKLPAD